MNQAGVSCYSPTKGMDTGHTSITGLLPGTGQVKDERCGTWTALVVCSTSPEDHPKKPIKHSCNRLECPECHTRVLIRNADNVALRVNGYREALSGQRTLAGGLGHARSPRHGILSPPASLVNRVYDRTLKALAQKYPDGNYSLEDLQEIYLGKLRYEVYKALEILGVDGAAVVIHFDRVTDAGKDRHHAARTYIPRWEWVRRQPDWKDLIYFSPHAHLAFYGYSLDTGEFYDLSGGWTFKNKGYNERKGIGGLAWYLLSHTPVIKGRLSVTYWGCLSPRKLKCVDEYFEREEVLCEVCGSVMEYASVDQDCNYMGLTGKTLYRKVRIRKYAIAGPPAPIHPGG